MTWRLLNDETPHTGAYNMALDQSLAESAAANGGVTLRFYRWSPSCVSVGDSQRLAKMDLVAIEAAGYDLVRRSTGGWAHLHTDQELTYSVTISEELMAADALYEGVNRAFAAALRGMGIDVSQNAKEIIDSTSASKAACFDIAYSSEVMWQGRKLLGSASDTGYGYTLLHGSLPLEGNPASIANLVAGDAERKAEVGTRMGTKAASLAAALGVTTGDRKLAWATLTDAIGDAIAAEFGVELQAGTLTKGETGKAQELIDSRYGNPEWTTRR